MTTRLHFLIFIYFLLLVCLAPHYFCERCEEITPGTVAFRNSELFFLQLCFSGWSALCYLLQEWWPLHCQCSPLDR